MTAALKCSLPVPLSGTHTQLIGLQHKSFAMSVKSCNLIHDLSFSLLFHFDRLTVGIEVEVPYSTVLSHRLTVLLELHLTGMISSHSQRLLHQYQTLLMRLGLFLSVTTLKVERLKSLMRRRQLMGDKCCQIRCRWSLQAMPSAKVIAGIDQSWEV